MPVEPAAFARAMSRVPGPVVIATTVDDDGREWGFTATSFSSLSLEPPLVSLSLGTAASTHAAFVAADTFLVSVLAQDQAEVARRFARSGTDRFAAGDMHPCEQGLPGLPGAAARIVCSLQGVLPGGDHSILVGRVEEAAVTEAAPLVYCDRSFTRLSGRAGIPLLSA
ncbi:flavin reductase family protein [Streptomyces sp. CRN 30]|uniref:flavin reductase family protein n=1 Tax=Streptomyces sp. CRN 30 TaxID=3075613 RepID=UPI002A80CB2B|nr:flavin reductase family protein [Streptomyces sp. CRN 30]